MKAPVSPAPPLPRRGQQRAWWRAPASPSALAWALASAARAHGRPLLMVARDNQHAHQVEADLHTLLGEGADLPVLPFPDWETLPYDQFSPHPEIVSQRLAALHRLPSLERGIVVVTVSTLMQRLPPPGYVIGQTFDLKTGQALELDAEKRRLESANYRHVPQVLDPGDFSVRGGLLDVYPMGADAPFRIELLDTDIESIRRFDPESQRSLDRVGAIHMLPGREVPLHEAARERAMEALVERFDIDQRRSALFQDLKAGIAPAGVEYYLPLFFESPRERFDAAPARPATATLFDYLADDAVAVIAAGALEAAERFHGQVRERHEQRRHDVERPLLPPDELWLGPDALRERLNRGERVEIAGSDHARHGEAVALGDQPAPELPLTVRNEEPAAALKSFLASY